MFSEKEKGEAIGVYQAYSDVEEGDIVVNKMAELRREKRYAYSDFAILYRTNAQSRILRKPCANAVCLTVFTELVVLSTQGNQRCYCLLPSDSESQ